MAVGGRGGTCVGESGEDGEDDQAMASDRRPTGPRIEFSGEIKRYQNIKKGSSRYVNVLGFV